MPVSPPSVVFGDHPSVLERLADPAVRLAIWTRANPCRMDSFPDFAMPEPDELSCLPDWLIGDIGVLGGLYARATDRAWRVRMETATARTCPGFHEDAVALRFLVTYRGPGTEWTTDLDGGAVERVPTGAVAAMKGRAWPSSHRLLHRSAKATRARPRWVMAMDASSSATPHIPVDDGRLVALPDPASFATAFAG